MCRRPDCFSRFGGEDLSATNEIPVILKERSSSSFVTFGEVCPQWYISIELVDDWADKMMSRFVSFLIGDAARGIRVIYYSVIAALLASTLNANGARAVEQLIASRINAKQLPQDFRVEAMKFTGPWGDGRRGSAGFVVSAKQGVGTRFSFKFQRDASGYGFQVIHPCGEGHAIVSVHSRGVTIHRGGSWGDIGWGNPATSDRVELNSSASVLLPLQPDIAYPVISELSPEGDYQLIIRNKVICRHAIKNAKPLVLEVPEDKRVWGGSGWNRDAFAGDGFNPRLQPGHAGLILGPMDGAGPRQSFQDVRLSLVASAEPGSRNMAATSGFEPLFRSIDNAREFDELVKSKLAGGNGGEAFEAAMDGPTLLVGFDYTLSRLFGGHLTVKSIRPIYSTRGGVKLGGWYGSPHGKISREIAKDGYAVTVVVAKHGHRLDGMRLIYMRARGGRLNPDDTYRSDWLGGRGGGRETLIATYGDPIVSVFGRRGHDLDAIGFVQFKPE